MLSIFLPHHLSKYFSPFVVAHTMFIFELIRCAIFFTHPFPFNLESCDRIEWCQYLDHNGLTGTALQKKAATARALRRRFSTCFKAFLDKRSRVVFLWCHWTEISTRTFSQVLPQPKLYTLSLHLSPTLRPGLQNAWERPPKCLRSRR